jgi:hypothetical protein
VPGAIDPVEELGAAVGHLVCLVPSPFVGHDIGEVVVALSAQFVVAGRLGDRGRRVDVCSRFAEVTGGRFDPSGEKQRSGALEGWRRVPRRVEGCQ